MNNLLQPQPNRPPKQENNRPQARPNSPPEQAQPIQNQADDIGRTPPTHATQGGVSRLPAKTQVGAVKGAGGGVARPAAPRPPSRTNKKTRSAQTSVRRQWAASRAAVGDNLDALDRELRARTGGAVTRRALVNVLALLAGGMVGWVFGKGLARTGAQEQVALERLLAEDSEILRELAAMKRDLADMEKRQPSPDADGRDIVDILQGGLGEGGDGTAGALPGGGDRAGDLGQGNAATGEGKVETAGAGEGGDAAGSDGGLVDGGLTLGVMGVLAWQASFLREEYELVQRRFARAEATWSEVLQYRLDYYLSGGAGGGNGSVAKTALLLNGTFLSILFGALLLAVTQGQGPSNALWNAWTYVADPGVQV